MISNFLKKFLSRRAFCLFFFPFSFFFGETRTICNLTLLLKLHNQNRSKAPVSQLVNAEVSSGKV